MPTRNQAIAALVAVPLFFVSGCSTAIDQELSQTTRLADPLLPVQEETAAPSQAETSSPAIDESPEEAVQEPLAEPTEEAVEESRSPEPTTEPSPEPEPSVEPIVKEDPSPLESAYAQVTKLFDDSYTDASSYITAHESIEPEIVSDIEYYLADAISTWDEAHGVQEFDVIVFRQDSAAWADEIRVANGDRIARGSFVEDVKISSQGEHCGFAYVLPGIVYLCIPNSGTNSSYVESLVAHEYFHLVQHSIGIDHTNLPIWIGEGSAALLGDMHQRTASQIKAHHANNYNSKMLQNFGAARLSELSDTITQEQVNLIYTKLEGYSVNNAQSLISEYNAYLFGAIAIEKLIGEYGYPTFIDFLESVGSGSYWKTAFEAYYGMTTGSFYEDMLTYIQTTY